MSQSVYIVTQGGYSSGTLTGKDWFASGTTMGSQPSAGAYGSVIEGKKKQVAFRIRRGASGSKYWVQTGIKSGSSYSFTDSSTNVSTWSKVSTLARIYESTIFLNVDLAWRTSSKIFWKAASGLTVGVNLGSNTYAIASSSSTTSYRDIVMLASYIGTSDPQAKEIQRQRVENAYVMFTVSGLGKGESLTVTGVDTTSSRYELSGNVLKVFAAYLETTGAMQYIEMYGDTPTITLGKSFSYEDVAITKNAVDAISGQTVPRGTFSAVLDADGEVIAGTVDGETTTFRVPAGYACTISYVPPATDEGIFNALGFGEIANLKQKYTFTASDTQTVRQVSYLFERRSASPSGSVDEPSRAAVASGAEVTIADPGGDPLLSPKVGDTAVFTAPVALNESYRFGGWYDESGLVSDSNPLTVALPESIELKAVYLAKTDFLKDETGGGTGSFTVDGTEYAEVPLQTLWPPLGSSLAVFATATTGVFYEWQKDGITDEDIVDEESVYVDAPHIYTAVFLDVFPEYHIACVSEVVVGADASEAGEFTLSGAKITGESAEDYEAAVGSSPPQGSTCYKTVGIASVRIQVEKTGSLGLNKVYAGNDTEHPLNPADPYTVSSNTVLHALWGETSTCHVEVSSSDTANGIAWIEGLSDSSTDVSQFAAVTVLSQPRTGYLFAGWYVGSKKVSDQTRYTFTVLQDTVLLAKFAKDPCQICVWEGSDENKTMEWTSKVYTLPKPFDPVAARVDATGYPVDLIVRTYSSPDKSNPLPVRDHELTSQNPLAVQSQDGRRLPRMRPERFMRVSVESTHEVDAIVVGTNMAEVN